MMHQLTSLADDRITWTYSCVVLVTVAFFILVSRLLGEPFLAFDFELTVVYLPTVVACLIALYLNLELKRTGKDNPLRLSDARR